MAFSLRWLLLFQSVGSRCMGFNRCSTRTELLWGVWDLPGPGMEPVSSALAGGFLSTGLPEKSLNTLSWFFYPTRMAWIIILIVWGFSHTGYNQLFKKKKIQWVHRIPRSHIDLKRDEWKGHYSRWKRWPGGLSDAESARLMPEWTMGIYWSLSLSSSLCLDFLIFKIRIMPSWCVDRKDL